MMMWEYSHYLLFVQAVSLFLLDSFALAQTEKVLKLIDLLVVGDLNTDSEVPCHTHCSGAPKGIDRAMTRVSGSLGPAKVHVLSFGRMEWLKTCSLLACCVSDSFPNKRAEPKESPEAWTHPRRDESDEIQSCSLFSSAFCSLPFPIQ